MKNKLIYIVLTAFFVSGIIKTSDCDSLPSGGNSPEEFPIVRHLDTREIEKKIMTAVSATASSMAQIPATCLHNAVKDNNLTAVSELINSGVNVNVTGPLMMTALTLATCNGCQLQIVETLIRAGADVNQRSIFGGLPLSNAIEAGNIEHVRVLLAAGANQNGRHLNRSVLEIAINNNKLEIAKMLIAAGSTVNSELLRKAIFTKNLDMVKLLVEAGVPINDPNSRTSVLSCVNKTNTEMTNYLISKGAVRTWDETCSIQ